MIQVDEEFYKPYTIGAPTERHKVDDLSGTRASAEPGNGGVFVICSAESYDHKECLRAEVVYYFRLDDSSVGSLSAMRSVRTSAISYCGGQVRIPNHLWAFESVSVQTFGEIHMCNNRTQGPYSTIVYNRGFINVAILTGIDMLVHTMDIYLLYSTYVSPK